MTTETVLGSVENLCLSEHLADVNFILDNGATKFPAHKLVLAMRSEVFEAMFYGLLKETTDEIRIDDIKADVFKHLLRYAYTDTTNFEATDIVECLYAATKYSLHGLVAKCSEEMKSCISTANVCTLYEQAQLYKATDLADMCFTYILENADEVMKTSDFCCLSYESVCRVLSRDEIITPEIDIFTALYNWAVFTSTGKGQGTSPAAIRQTMGDALFLVRLLLVPVAAITDVVVKCGILTSDETINIYQYLTTKSQGAKGKVGKFSSLPRQSAVYIANIPPTPQIAPSEHRVYDRPTWQITPSGQHVLYGPGQKVLYGTAPYGAGLSNSQFTCSIDTALGLRVKCFKLRQAVNFASAGLNTGGVHADVTRTVAVEDGGRKLVFDPPPAKPAGKSTFTFNTTTECPNYNQTVANFQCFGSDVTIVTQGIVKSVCLMHQSHS